MEVNDENTKNDLGGNLLGRVLGRLNSERNFLGSRRRAAYFSIFLILGFIALVAALFSLKNSANSSGIDSLSYIFYNPASAIFAAKETAFFILEGLPAGSIAIVFFACAAALLFLKYASKSFKDSQFWSDKINKYKNGTK